MVVTEVTKVRALNQQEIECVSGGDSIIPPPIGIYDYWPFNQFRPRWETGAGDPTPEG
jgi:hypothetical protein